MSAKPPRIGDADHLASGARRIRERPDHVHDRRNAELAAHRADVPHRRMHERREHEHDARALERARHGARPARRSRRRAASRTSALPHCVVNERLPCLATRTPAPATSSAAAVEMLKVLIVPPPVPQVSTRSSGRSAGSSTIASRNARTTAASSAGVSPFTRSPIEQRRDLHRRRVAAEITTSNASVSSLGPAARRPRGV